KLLFTAWRGPAIWSRFDAAQVIAGTGSEADRSQDETGGAIAILKLTVRRPGEEEGTDREPTGEHKRRHNAETGRERRTFQEGGSEPADAEEQQTASQRRPARRKLPDVE